MLMSMGMEAGLDGGHANPKFVAGDSAGDSRIHITNDDDPVRPLRDADFLEGDHDARRWLRVGSGIWRSSKELPGSWDRNAALWTSHTLALDDAGGAGETPP